MIIVSGWLKVRAADRAAYLDGCRVVIATARDTAGCLDFYLSPDPIDPERINIFEQWADAQSVERFRGSGTSDEQQNVIVDAHVDQHEIARTTPLT